MQYFCKHNFALVSLIHAISTSNAFVVNHATSRQGSTFRLHASQNDQIVIPPPAMAVGAASTILTFAGGVDAALASSIPQAHMETMVVSSTMAQSQSVDSSFSSSNIPTQKELLEKSSSLGGLSSTGMLLSAVSSNTADAGVSIVDINFDGKVPKTEADEYVVIKNNSKTPIDISGYYIYVATTGTQGPTFYFPKSSEIKPGSTVRVYTNEIHKETGGYSYGSGKALWNNNSGLAVFKDANGKKIGEYKYKAS